MFMASKFWFVVLDMTNDNTKPYSWWYFMINYIDFAMTLPFSLFVYTT